MDILGISRREFLRVSAAAAAAAAAEYGPSQTGSARAADAANSVAPSEQIRVAVVGCRGRGMAHVSEFLSMKDVTVAALCDVDSACVGKAVEAVEKKTNRKPAVEADIRKILDDKTIDAISIATPNHWHCLATLWAVQAGKDVYVEKPLSHNVFEGRQVVAAARKYNRIVQHGTQRRSSAGIRSAVEFLRAGKLGKVTTAVGLCYKSRGSIGQHTGPVAVPSTANYDLWLGPAANKPLERLRFHYDWHWFWDYGNGDIGNQGVHQIDVARWGLGKSEHPAAVVSLGGRFGYTDDGQTPNTQLSVCDYGDAQLIFEVRGLKTAGYEDDVKIGNIFYGTEGILTVEGKGGIVAWMGAKREPTKIPPAGKAGPGGGHFGNFIAAMRSRKPTDLNAEVLEGHLSSVPCHLANISYRLGKTVSLDARGGVFDAETNPKAAEMHTRMLEHLTANGVKLDRGEYRLGATLKFDGKTEKFVENAEADMLLSREYRAPFVVPDVV